MCFHTLSTQVRPRSSEKLPPAKEGTGPWPMTLPSLTPCSLPPQYLLNFPGPLRSVTTPCTLSKSRITVSSQFCVFPTRFLNLSHSSLLEPPQDIQSTEPSNFSLSINSFLTSFCSFSSVQFSSAAQLYPTLCDPMDCNMPGFPVHHQLPELTQTHVHRVSVSYIISYNKLYNIVIYVITHI